MTTPLYYQYWGKADEALKVAYCSGIDKETIVNEFKQKIAYQLKNPISELQITQLDILAKQKKWQYNQPTYSSYHLLPYHCLDVAAVGYLLLSPDKPLCKKIAIQLDVEAEWLRDFFVFCLTLHDLGKFSRSFQGLRQGLSPDLVKENSRMPYSERHDSLGFCLWRDELQAGLDKQLEFSNLNTKEIKTWLKYIEPWLEIVTGHHGIPPKRKLKERIGNFFQPEDKQAAFMFTQKVLSHFLSGFTTLYHDFLKGQPETYQVIL